MILVDANVALEYKKIPLFFHKSQIAFTGPVLGEIKRLAGEENEKVLLTLVEGVKVVETEAKNADLSIVEAASKYRCSVATLDKQLIGKLKKGGITVLKSRGEIIQALND
ncbi:MAG: hypothetical protein JW727_06170 [Candidatus Aenigmarchaeota archaeon]|nr:hypothetical protein [Candidatus Aenigmarchaeota archaeon]